MRVQYFACEYEMADHINFNNEATTAKLLTEKKIVIRQSIFFQNNYHKTQTTEMTTDGV